MKNSMITGWAKKVLFILTLCSFSVFASAQKIATIDINQLLEGMADYKKANEDLEKQAATWRQEISQKQDEVKSLYNKYQAEMVLLSPEVRKEREEEIMNREKIMRDMQREKFGTEGALFKRRQELVKPIQDKVYGAIESYANEKGHDLILDKATAGIIFNNNKFDKTAEIAERLKK